MRKHVVVISQDAMIFEDIQTLQTFPNFSKVWDRTARVDRMRSIYPTITYPAHVSMMTGVYPDRHGVTNNEQPGLGQKSAPWHHFREAVKVPTIFDHAKAHGLTTAAVFWPVTGLDPSIDYLIDEFWPQTKDVSLRDCFAQSGSSAEVMEKIVDPNMHLLVNRTHPQCDAFIHACAAAIIRQFKPNLLMVHPANIDAYRHETGLFSPRVTQGLYEVDLWFGEIVKATMDAGIYDDTDFFIVSDHGQLNIRRQIALNCALVDRGLITLNAQGGISDFTAFVKGAGLSAQVYLKNPQDMEAARRTKDVLDALCREEVYGIERVYTAEEAEREERLAGGFSFVLEGDGFTSFISDWQRPLMRPFPVTDPRLTRAGHGHHPDKGPQPTLFAFGPHLRPGAHLADGHIVDEPPTIARVLGFTMPDTDGVVLDALLQDVYS